VNLEISLRRCVVSKNNEESVERCRGKERLTFHKIESLSPLSVVVEREKKTNGVLYSLDRLRIDQIKKYRKKKIVGMGAV
jgi:hypothetical protein